MTHWTFIRECILRSLPPMIEGHDLALLEIQSKLLVDEMQAWFGLPKLGSSAIYGVMTTGVVQDEFSGTKNMLIYTVTITNAHPKELWQHAYGVLRKYAKSRGCNKIISYTNQMRILEIALELGADVEWHLVQLNV